MIADKYWHKFYNKHVFDSPSTFAQFCLDKIDAEFIELGCGDGRDLYYFLRNEKDGWGVDANGGGIYITTMDVNEYMDIEESPDIVYTRFFWHSIDTETRIRILDWTKKKIFIEARTTEDKPKDIYGKHDRNLVDVEELGIQLGERGFTVTHFEQGYGLSPYLGEDPHLFRLIAEKA